MRGGGKDFRPVWELPPSFFLFFSFTSYESWVRWGDELCSPLRDLPSRAHALHLWRNSGTKLLEEKCSNLSVVIGESSLAEGGKGD